MDIRESLTTEEIKKKFKSQFDLVTYAISLAENMIKTGREPRVKVDCQNRAMQILEEIVEGKDKLDDLPVELEGAQERVETENQQQRRLDSKKSFRTSQSKFPTSKKGRKILTEHAAK